MIPFALTFFALSVLSAVVGMRGTAGLPLAQALVTVFLVLALLSLLL